MLQRYITRTYVWLVVIILVTALISGCSYLPFIAKKVEEARKTELERVGDTQAQQIYIDGFEDLTLKEKILAYYLYKAGLAGRDIFWHQNHKHALKIRDLCEGIYTHPKGIDPEVYEKIKIYTHRLWLNCCQYNLGSKKKFTPDCSYEEFVEAAQIAQRNGANFNLNEGESLEERLEMLKPYMFDPNFEPMVCAKNPPPGKDILTASANNFYEGVTLAEVNEWAAKGLEKNPLNSKVVKQNGQIVELVYRAGDPENGIPPGMYAKELSEVIKYLELAIPYAEAEQQEVIKALIKHFKTGDLKDFDAYNILWVRNNPTVDFILGFIEVYMDARGQKGSFESLVYFADKKKVELMRKFSELAPYFEARAPWLDKYKKKKFKTMPIANSILVISGMGDAGPNTPAGINLPNVQWIRERYGSKNVMLSNVMGGEARPFTGKREITPFMKEFYHPDDIKALKKLRGGTGYSAVCLHEIVGHGSGKVSPRLTEDPADYLDEFYSTLEEARAELMALWNIHDPKLQEIGAVTNTAAADEVYRTWARNDLLQLRRYKDRDTIEQDHARARHLIVSYIREKGGIDMVKIKGKLYTKVNSIKKMRQAVGELLAEIMRIKAEGDYEAAKKLVQTYGIYFNKEWRDEMVKRYREYLKGKPPIKHRGIAMPVLEPVKDEKGNIIDIKVTYFQNFEKEQLYYAGKTIAR